MLKGLPEALGESSFLGLVLAGTAVVILAPALRNVLRGVAVATAKGVISVTEGGAALASNVKEGWEDVVAQAKAQKGLVAPDKSTLMGAGAGGAIGASLGGMAGPVGAAIGGGLGGVTGATVGNEIARETKEGKTNSPENHGPEN